MASGQTKAPVRQAPGGNASVMLGDDSTKWESTSIARRDNVDAEQAVTQVVHEPRMTPGGVDSVQLGGPIANPTVEELLLRPSPGGTDSMAFGKEIDAGPSAAELRLRAAPGGKDSVGFGESNESATVCDLLSRPAPGGKATVVLGGDEVQWSTCSQAHGVRSVEACVAMQAQTRLPPGGADSIDFCAPPDQPSAHSLLARSSPGGCDSIVFGAITAPGVSAQDLRARPQPGGADSVVFGKDKDEWTRASQAMGVGSVEAIAAMKPVSRAAPGGLDSVEFGGESFVPSKEELLTKPAVGGKSAVVLGLDEASWATNSNEVGAGSAEAVAQAEPHRVRLPPGGADSVSRITDGPVENASVEELLRRPATGGKASVVLGGDATEWVTSSDSCKIPNGYVATSVPKQNVGGVDSIAFGAVESGLPTVEYLLSRPAPGGTDSVQFGMVATNSISVDDLIARPSPGGNDGVVLGSNVGDWATSSQAHSNMVANTAENANFTRPPPGGVDSVDMSTRNDNFTVEELLARPAVGGAATVVLGGDDSQWLTCSGSFGNGCVEAAAKSQTKTAETAVGAKDSVNFANDGPFTPAKPRRVMNAEAASSTVTLEDNSFTPTPGVSSNRFASGANPNAGNVLTERSTTRLSQAPGGHSSLVLGDDDSKGDGHASKSVCGSNQNQGNVLTARPTTSLHQAPGGNSSIDLGDDRVSPAIGGAVKRTIKVREAPGGATTICLGDDKTPTQRVQDENSNANMQRALQDVVKVTQAPGGNSLVILG